MAKKSVFDESALDDDLDEFLPKVGMGNRAGQSEPTPPPVAAPETPAPAPAVQTSQPGGGGGATGGSRNTKAGDSDVEGNPTAEISADNLVKLRSLNLAEKKKNPANARTYGQIVLDAIDAGHEELARHWKQSESVEKAP